VGNPLAIRQADAKDRGWTAGTANHFCLGKRAGEAAKCFDGIIDEVMVFSRALSPNELKTLYNVQKPVAKR